MKDRFSRTIDYMRVSVTDRCNLRCRYCMPQGIRTVPMSEVLTYEEILEVVRAAAWCGISRLKITGGEPLVRLGVAGLVRELKRVPGVEQVTMTTNGALLAAAMPELKAAGLDAVNVSLDTLDAGQFQEITGFDLLDAVKSGIDAALSAGIPTKVNAVLQEGVNEDEWDRLLQMARTKPLDVRFIELMPMGEGRRFYPVNNERLLEAIREKYPGMERDQRVHGNGPAVYFRIPGFQGGVGFISALHGKFCGSCNRLRLTALGGLKSCLCFADSLDLRSILRSTHGEEKKAALREAIRTAIEGKPQGHRFEERDGVSEPHGMSEIGG